MILIFSSLVSAALIQTCHIRSFCARSSTAPPPHWLPAHPAEPFPRRLLYVLSESYAVRDELGCLSSTAQIWEPGAGLVCAYRATIEKVLSSFRQSMLPDVCGDVVAAQIPPKTLMRLRPLPDALRCSIFFSTAGPTIMHQRSTHGAPAATMLFPGTDKRSPIPFCRALVASCDISCGCTA